VHFDRGYQKFRKVVNRSPQIEAEPVKI